MKYIKTYESLNINEGQDMMFMPSDPIAKSSEVYSEVIQWLKGIVTKLDKSSISDFKKLKEELKKNPEEAKKIASALKDEGYEDISDFGKSRKIDAKEYWIDKLKSWGVGALFVGLLIYIIMAGSVATGSVAPSTPEIIYAALIAAGFGGLLGDAALSNVRKVKE
jgi:hypothetical protein